MTNETLETKIREKVKAGMSEGAIKSSLMIEGWSLSDIDKVMEVEIGGKKIVEKKSVPVFVYFGYTLLGVVLVLGVGFLALKVVPGKEEVTTQENGEILVTQMVTATPTEEPLARPIEQIELLSATDYVDEKDKYRIRPPEGWEVDTSGKLGAPVYFFGPSATASGNFIYKANIHVLTGPANNNSLESYVSYYLRGLELRLEGFKVKEQRNIVVSGRNMVVARHTFILDGHDFSGMSLILVEHDKAFIVTGTALTSGYPLVKQAMDLSIYSFNVL